MNESCHLKLTIVDDFFPENDGSHVVHFENGRAQLANNSEYEVEIKLDVAEFSSLIVGAISFSQLYRYGLAQISDERYVDGVNQLFRVAERPLCMTTF